MVEGPVGKITCKEVRGAIRKMKQGKAAGLSESFMEMVAATSKVQDCGGSDATALPMSFGWKGNPR